MHSVSRFFQLLVACILAFVYAGELATAQPALPVPQASPLASISQTIGITNVTITYHRPGVKNRKIWGGLVPYGAIWRVGANENTTISFSDPVKVEGKILSAGSYGLHMIPSENQWTIIFSKNSTSWGSYFYKESEDALRVMVTPQPSEYREWMGFEFEDLTNSSAVATLRWEKLKVPIKIELDERETVLTHARDSYLRGSAAFSWQGFNQAARYCLQNNVNLEEALAWADKSISMNENVTNLTVKAGLLEKLGKAIEANAVREKALKVATTEAELNTLGYQYLGANNAKQAINVFKRNVKAHPDSWNVYKSLGEAYEKLGDTKEALENYSKALKLTKDEAQKKRLTEAMKKLEGK